MNKEEKAELKKLAKELHKALNSREGRNAIKNKHLDFPWPESLSQDEWNTLPFGAPGACRANLLVCVIDEDTVAELINSALIHAAKKCRATTKLVFFSVFVDKEKWVENWELYKPAFKKLEREAGIVVVIAFAKRASKPKALPAADFLMTFEESTSMIGMFGQEMKISPSGELWVGGKKLPGLAPAMKFEELRQYILKSGVLSAPNKQYGMGCDGTSRDIHVRVNGRRYQWHSIIGSWDEHEAVFTRLISLFKACFSV